MAGGQCQLAWNELSYPTHVSAKACQPGVQLESGLLEDLLPTKRNPIRMMVSVSRELWLGISHWRSKMEPAAIKYEAVSASKYAPLWKCS